MNRMFIAGYKSHPKYDSNVLETSTNKHTFKSHL